MSHSPPTSHVKAGLNHFFFDEQVPFGAALTRIFLPLAALLPMLMRFPRVRELYSTDGISLQMFELFGEGPVLPVLDPTPAIMLYSVMVFCLLSGSAGWNTRWSLGIGTSLYIYFNLLDGIGTMTKYSVIASHLLVLLTLSPCGRIWSVDDTLRRHRQNDSAAALPRTSIWSVRCMQVLFAFVYFGAAVTKIQTSAFFSGEQMRYWMLSNWNYENPVGEVMSMWPPVLLVSAYITCIWEILFAALVWNPRFRLPVLGIGAIFHVMTWLTLGLYIFPAICIAGYLCFVTPQDVIHVRRWLQSRSFTSGWSWPTLSAIPRWIPAGAAWGVVGCLFTVVAVEAEVQNDLYGLNSSEGRYTLTEIAPETAVHRIRSEEPLREKDKVFSFHLGSTVVGGQLASRRTDFEFGEVVLAECNLNPPHEDMWIECNLNDDEDHTIESYGQFVTREMMRTHFSYHIGNRIVPGDYALVLKSAGQEIARRNFRISGEVPQMVVSPEVYGN